MEPLMHGGGTHEIAAMNFQGMRISRKMNQDIKLQMLKGMLSPQSGQTWTSRLLSFIQASGLQMCEYGSPWMDIAQKKRL
jgi:hypothetical protein